MPGLYTNGMEIWGGSVDALGTQALIPMDTNLADGESPQSVAISALQLGFGGVIVLTDGALIATNLALGKVFSVTLAGNRTLSNPTNPIDGQEYIWQVTQGSGGNHTLAYGNKFIWPGGAPTASTAAAAIDVIRAIYNATSDKYLAVMTKAYAA